MLETALQGLNLSPKEIEVYSKIIEYGKLSPARVSAMTSINRTTVYAVGKELVQKGYIREDALKGTTYYYPTPPKDLVKIAKKERQALIEKELQLEELAKTIRALPQSKTYAVPKISFIEGEEKVKNFLYDRSRAWSENFISGTTWWGFQDHSFVEHESYRGWIKWFWKDAPENIDLKLLSNNSEIEKEMEKGNALYPRRHIRFWKKDVDFTTSQWIVGDYSIMLQTKEDPYYLVEMHDAVYAANMRELFKNLWEEV